MRTTLTDKRIKRTLKLGRETLQTLSPDALNGVNGGECIASNSCYCPGGDPAPGNPCWVSNSCYCPKK